VRAERRLPLILIPALVIGGAAALACPTPDRLAVAVVAACAALALDPDAAGDLLSRAARPDAAARTAPAVAALALGMALILSAPASGHLPWHWLVAFPLGGLLGILLVGLLRLTEGKGMVLALLFTFPILGWGLARHFELSPLATIFCAGTLVADDLSRRDLVFSLLREYQRPFTIAMLALTAMSLPLSPEPLGSWFFWATAGLLILIRPLAWRLVPGTGLSLRQTLPMSPLVLPLAVEGGPGPVSLAVALAWIVSEIASRLPFAAASRA
jgi:hypothetical protein